MRISKSLVAITVLSCFFSFQSCKKHNDPAPNPVPAVKVDTLTTGWTRQTVAGETALADIFFNSATTGYAVGTKIYKSTDGGNAWNPVLSTPNLYNIFMTNDSKAFFGGQANTMIKTIDGGSSFVNTIISTTPSDIFFTDNNNGFSSTQNGLYGTVDGGMTWSKITTTGLPSNPTYSSLHCINNTTGWIVMQGLGVYRSVGSFATWQQAKIDGGFPAFPLSSVYASSASTIYIASSGGAIFKSTNGGTSFSYIKTLEDRSFTDLYFLTDQVGYASSGSHIYKTTDGGTSWSTVVSLANSGVIEIHFTDATHGWACGGGTVLIFKQ